MDELLSKCMLCPGDSSASAGEDLFLLYWAISFIHTQASS